MCSSYFLLARPFRGKPIFFNPNSLVEKTRQFEHGCVHHFGDLAILAQSAIISSITRLSPSRRLHFATIRRRISSCQGHDNSNTSCLNVFHSRKEGKRERRKNKGRKPNKYRRNCYGIPLQAIVNLRKVARDCETLG